MGIVQAFNDAIGNGGLYGEGIGLLAVSADLQAQAQQKEYFFHV